MRITITQSLLHVRAGVVVYDVDGDLSLLFFLGVQFF
jgi:hypothetical protein